MDWLPWMGVVVRGGGSGVPLLSWVLIRININTCQQPYIVIYRDKYCHTFNFLGVDLLSVVEKLFVLHLLLFLFFLHHPSFNVTSKGISSTREPCCRVATNIQSAL